MRWEYEPRPASDGAGQAQLRRLEGAELPNAAARWLLLDLLAEVPDPLSELLDRPGLLRLSAASRPDIPSDRSPVLVPLADDDPALGWSLTAAHEEAVAERLLMSQGRCVGGWITTAPGQDAARRMLMHLQALMFQRVPGVGPRFIRLTDGRVWTSLVPGLSPNEQSALLGPLHSWHVLDLCGGLCGLRRGADTSSAVPVSPWSPSLNHWGQLQRMSVVHRSLARWHLSPRTATLGQDASRPQHELSALADRAVNTAAQEGFSQPDDLEAYALHALWYGEAFAQQEPWRAAVSEAKTQRRPLDDVMSDVVSSEPNQPLNAS